MPTIIDQVKLPKISILFFGTTDFSATVLTALATTQGFTVVGVVTQPDRPVGRSKKITPPPVKVTAKKLGLPIWQPESLKRDSSIPPRQGAPLGMTEKRHALPGADIFVVFAYGLIIPQAILDLPPYGAINIHPSLLPKYRGPTPVQTAIIKGDTETGVSLILLDEQMDHGTILSQLKMPIDPNDTTETLTSKLVTAATPLLVQTIQDWIHQKITPTPQDDSQATYCKMLTRDDGRVNWSQSAREIYNLYRGLTPWPGIWTMQENKRLKLLRIVIPNAAPERSRGGGVEESLSASSRQALSPGMIRVKDRRIFIGCGDDSVEILELQREGKKAVSAEEFSRGYKNFDGAKLI
ncbi:MAG: methionyl-tRNA formyltransferase [Candidatus Magasanikbacteria bacterium]|nr:methionyl-tRNA formyltransferase [Candidatus Magasanikbacteria bacterium]